MMQSFTHREMRGRLIVRWALDPEECPAASAGLWPRAHTPAEGQTAASGSCTVIHNMEQSLHAVQRN